MSDLAAALMVAIRVHAGQSDKQGEPYLLHVLRVVEAVSDEAKTVAALHDVLEDSDVPAAELAPVGLEGDEWVALEALTRKPARWTYAEYIDQVAGHADHAGVLAREVKLADLRDNVARIPSRETTKACGAGCFCEWDRNWRPLKARYERAIATLEAAA